MNRKLKVLLTRLFAPRSLRYQLLTRSLFMLAIILMVIGFLQYVLMKDFIYANKAEAMRSQMLSVPRDLYRQWNSFRRDDPDGDSEVHNRRRPLLLVPDTTLAFITPEGKFRDLLKETGMGNPAPKLSVSEYQTVLQNMTARHFSKNRVVRNVNGSEQLVVFMPVGIPGHPEGILQMSTDTGPLKEIIIRQLFIFLFLSMMALLAGLMVYLPVLRKTLVPLSKMGDTVQRIDAGNLTERFPVQQGQQEIDRLAYSFNGMLERLEESFQAEKEAKEQMRRFVADASHELRTPLTSIHGFLEVLLRGAAEKREQLYSALRSMHRESKRINKLVEDLLLLAKLDRAPQLQFSDISLDEVVREMEPHLHVLAGNRVVNFDISSGIRGMYDADKIKQVILNLFQNAVQHTDPEQGKIHLSLAAEGAWTKLSIHDNGPGIVPEQLPHVFERFYRGESSRSRKYGGTGLGLSISKSIVEAHGGSIAVDSTPSEGSVFTVILPCRNQ